MAAAALAAYAGPTVVLVSAADATETGGPLLRGSLEDNFALRRRLELPAWPPNKPDVFEVWQRRGGEHSPVSVSQVPAPLADAAPCELLGGWPRRRRLLAALDAKWGDAAGSLLLARALAGGGRARRTEAQALADAIRHAPLLRRLILRVLC